MNLKRIVLFSVILMISISSLSMVTAGWFDFMSDNSGIIGGEIQDDSAEYELMLKVAVESSEIINVVCMDWDGEVVIKLTNATGEQKEIIEDTIDNNISNFNISFNYKGDIITEAIEPYDDINATLDGDTLTINYHADYRVDSDDSSSQHYVYDNNNNAYNVKSNIDSTSGSLSLKNGNITISGENPITIIF